MTDERELAPSDFADGMALGMKIGYRRGVEDGIRELTQRLSQNPEPMFAVPSRFSALVQKGK